MKAERKFVPVNDIDEKDGQGNILVQMVKEKSQWRWLRWLLLPLLAAVGVIGVFGLGWIAHQCEHTTKTLEAHKERSKIRESELSTTIQSLKNDLRDLESFHVDFVNDTLHEKQKYELTIKRLMQHIETLEDSNQNLQELFQQRETEYNKTMAHFQETIENITVVHDREIDGKNEQIFSLEKDLNMTIIDYDRKIEGKNEQIFSLENELNMTTAEHDKTLTNVQQNCSNEIQIQNTEIIALEQKLKSGSAQLKSEIQILCYFIFAMYLATATI